MCLSGEMGCLARDLSIDLVLVKERAWMHATLSL